MARLNQAQDFLSLGSWLLIQVKSDRHKNLISAEIGRLFGGLYILQVCKLVSAF